MNQKSTIYMESKISLMGTFKCTLGHAQGALLLIIQNSFNANSVNKTTSSVSLQHCAQYRQQYSVCVTPVPHKQSISPYHIIMHFSETEF